MTRPSRPGSPGSGGGGRRGWLIVSAVAAAVIGVVAIGFAVVAQQSPPRPGPAQAGRISASAPIPATGPTPRAEATSAPGRARQTSPAHPLRDGLTPSLPTSVAIPAIGVSSTVFPLGKNADGTLAVPQPGPRENDVAWYRGSAAPGSAGPAVLEGHVDTTSGPSIFYRLGALRIGEHIIVTRSDGLQAIFTVNAVRAYPTHADFPVEEIFAADLSVPSLRLITCSNFDAAIGHYVGNTVVYAHLTAVHRP